MINIEKIKADAKKMLEDSHGSHDWEHTLRVYNLAVHISKTLNADMDVVEAAAVLHDIARHEQDCSGGKICHAEKGAFLAEQYLQKEGYNKDFIERVVHAVKAHRFRGTNIPESIEAKILFDADKLDSSGAVGIARSFHFAGDHKAKLHDPIPNTAPEAEYTVDDTAYREFIVKLSKIKNRLFTIEAKKIAVSRHDFMNTFFERLNEEYLGNM